MRNRRIHTDDYLSVRVYHCLGHDTPPSSPEYSPTFDIFLPWNGLYLLKNGKEEQVAVAGQACFVTAGSEYRVRHPIGGHDTNTVVSLPRDAYRQILADRVPAAMDLPDDRLGFRSACGSLSPDLARRHSALLRAAQSAARDPIRVEELALGLARDLVNLSAGASDATPGVRASSRAYYRDRCNFVKTYLAQHAARTVSLAEVATAAAVSPFHLTRIFAMVEGHPIHRYLNRLRLHQTLAPLRETDLPLTTIALEAGFSSHSHFTAAFKAEFGIAPSQMRRN